MRYERSGANYPNYPNQPQKKTERKKKGEKKQYPTLLTYRNPTNKTLQDYNPKKTKQKSQLKNIPHTTELPLYP